MKKKIEKKKAVTGAAGENFRLETIPVSTVEHAPWNPRTKDELARTHPAMAELIDSITARGVIEPIVVWSAEDGRLLCIAGNRRLAAARFAGLKKIEAKIYFALTEDEARAITRAENEVRFGVSPLADAAQIRQLMDRGLAQNEIAALFGVSEARVCRRAKLLDLVPEVLDALKQSGVDAPALTLEIIAAHPAELQRDAARSFSYCSFRWKPAEARRVFDNLTRLIDKRSWVFQGDGIARFERCSHCAKCTGAQPTLFDLDGGDGENSGRCLDVKCFAEMEAAARQEIVDAALAKFKVQPVGAVKFAKYQFCEPFSSAAKKPSKKNDHALVYFDECAHTAHVRWTPDPSIARKEKQAARAALKAENEKIAAAGSTIRELEDAAEEKVYQFFAGSSGEDDWRDSVITKLKTLTVDVLAEMLADELLSMDAFSRSLCECDARYSAWAIRHFHDLAATLTDAERAAIERAAREEA
ncbi:MAG: ParB/RepB/Spo0J family partition protein [Kiritimatiellae bacterium]|nr:ParB/RepB/Spo0J family partition protein [Kiritimatiellia bacterium]MBQ8126711.1 ParB/RepB/Spo0J family partition protein [Kiritimatiellia bacterium]